MLKKLRYILWYREINKDDNALVGGKNASLGEMIRTLGKEEVNIPDGFCLTCFCFMKFLYDLSISTFRL